MLLLPLLFVGFIILAGWCLTRRPETEADRLARRDRWVHSRGWSFVDGPLSRMDELKPYSKARRRMIYERAHEDFNRDHPWLRPQTFLIPLPLFLVPFAGRINEWLMPHLPLGPIAAYAVRMLVMFLMTIATILGIHALIFLRVKPRIGRVLDREQPGPPGEPDGLVL